MDIFVHRRDRFLSSPNTRVTPQPFSACKPLGIVGAVLMLAALGCDGGIVTVPSTAGDGLGQAGDHDGQTGNGGGDGDGVTGGDDASTLSGDNTPPEQCSDTLLNGDESDVDCGGTICAACNDGDTCGQDGDCLSGTCNSATSTCTSPNCNDSLLNQDESDVDCGGITCNGCAVDQACLNDIDCASTVCSFDLCSNATCDDNTLNGDETGMDCGGPNCARCPDNDPCASNDDCVSGACGISTNVCTAPSCDDRIHNGTEAGPDCGGPCLALSPAQRCGVGDTCTDPNDCTSALCIQDTCRAQSCGDGIKNFGESDVDCGGPDCPACDTTDLCAQHSDCQSGSCDSSTQQCVAATCNDTLKNGDETDIDCGGSCTACADGGTCTVTGDCHNGDCTGGLCVASTCSSGTQDGNETGVDCGGSCAPCATSGGCNDASDCSSRVCVVSTQQCAAPTCGDSVQNGDESDVDCGGSCGGCGVGGSCADGYDCVSSICADSAATGTRTCALPSCSDGVQNGAETGRDCGGTCRGCADGDGCLVAGDCDSGVCDSSTQMCAAPACDDGLFNGDETAVDCGGSCAALSTPQRCADGEACINSPDCANDVCFASVCIADHCSTAILDGNETGVDCGGSCAPCSDGTTCLAGDDCVSGSCGVDNVCGGSGCSCQAPTCTDGVQNGNETGLDCGASCATCDNGAECLLGSDCTSGVCETGLCQPATCTDGVQNGDETSFDCGGSCATACPTGGGCNSGADCQTSSCGPQNSCTAPPCACQPSACDDGVQNGTETATDCGGLDCGGCATGVACDGAADCLSGVCDATGGLCEAPTCTDTVHNGSETGPDCGGSCAALATPQLCAVGEGCAGNGDCVSTFCSSNLCLADHCNNGGTADFDETDVDCGGADCAPCTVGKGCDDGGDCTTGSCGVDNNCPAGGCQCQAPSCSDGVHNGSETAVDCGDPGNSGCSACGTGLACVDGADCLSGVCSGSMCQAARCGDGVVNGADECDDGNNSDVDACRNSCVDARCGDGVWRVDLGAGDGGFEQCDDGDSTDTNACRNSCLSAFCGDGVTRDDLAGGAVGAESCDDANNEDADACRNSCAIAVCGDGMTRTDLTSGDSGYEACDDGNTDSCNGGCLGDCSATVLITGCGDGTLCGAEVCDDGNQDNCLPMGPGCNSTCTAAVDISGCNDGVVCGTEVCDTTSVGIRTCGDEGFGGGILQCDAVCTAYDVNACTDGCGNGRVDSGELCDGSAMAGNSCSSMGYGDGTLVCASTCDAFDATACTDGCGNGIRETGEECDVADFGGTPVTCADKTFTGGSITTCLPDCSVDVSTCTGGCGDGVLDGGEDCDPALAFTDTCADIVGTGSSGTLACAADCTWNSTACVVCGDGVRDAGEACDPGDGAGIGADLGGMTCALQGATAGTLACAADCSAFDTTACSSCGDGIINNGETCDSNNLNGETCLTIGGGFEGGALACNDTCSGFDDSSCNDCDTSVCPGVCSTDTDGICTCGLHETLCGTSCINTRTDPLNCGGCGADDPAFICTVTTDVSTTESCSAGRCMTQCEPPLVPHVDLSTGEYTGRCVNSLITDDYCSDIQPFSASDCGAGSFCVQGGCVDDGDAQDLTSTLSDPNPAFCANGGEPLDLNIDSGPLDDSQSCTGDLAAANFRWGLCSCNDIDHNQPLFIDGFDSRQGPYMPTCEDGVTLCSIDDDCDIDSDGPNALDDLDGDGLLTCAANTGAGLGANGSYSNNSQTRVWGALWSQVQSSNLGDTSIRQNLYMDGNLEGKSVYAHCDTSGSTPELCDAYVEGNVQVSGRVDGSLHSNAGSAVDTGFAVGGDLICSDDDIIVTTSDFSDAACNGHPDFDVAAPCDCNAEQLIPVVELIDGHACRPQGTATDAAPAPTGCAGVECCVSDSTGTIHNNNADIGLDPDILAGNNNGLLTLPCGIYYLSAIDDGNGVANVVVTGRTAIFVDGEIDVSKLTLTLTDSAELDIFVRNGVCTGNSFNLGSPNFPARTRMYIAAGGLANPAGGEPMTCNSDSTYAMRSSGLTAAGNIYAPWGVLMMPQAMQLYGGMFLGGYQISNKTTVHFDTGIVNAGETCPSDCGNGVLDGIEACDPGDLSTGLPPIINDTCSTLGYDGGTVICTSDCTIDPGGCFDCGDGIVNGTESCEPSILPVPETCSSLGLGDGAVTCQLDCSWDTSGCNVCGNSIIEAGETCDLAELAGATCVSLGYDGGELGCEPTCDAYDTSGCFNCGDGAIDAGEICDPGDGASIPENLNNLTCDDFGYTGGTLACRLNCAINTDDCTACGNLVLETGEACDGTNFNGETCVSRGFDRGELVCDANCGIDDSGCFDCVDTGSGMPPECMVEACGNGVVEGDEECDLSDLDGETCQTQLFDGGSLACNVDCTLNTNGCTTCGNSILEPGEACDDTDFNGETCASQGFTDGTLVCDPNLCTLDTVGCYRCGDDIIEAGIEDCEPNITVTETCADVLTGGSGPLTCNANCVFDTGACIQCGNKIIETGEQCDDTNLNNQTCITRGFSGGTLACDGGCQFDETGCGNCGDGTIDGGENCDPGDGASIPESLGGADCTTAGFDGGTLSCLLNCDYDTAGCYECGDGVINAGESCDGNALGGESCMSLTNNPGTLACHPADGSALECTFDQSGCSVCQDGTRNGDASSGEECDVDDFIGTDDSVITCQDKGFDTGTIVACNADCTVDTTPCAFVGECLDGTRDGDATSGEECDTGDFTGTDGSVRTCIDEGFDGGTIDGCLADCTVDTSGCYRCGDGIKNGTEACDQTDLGGATCTSEGFGGSGTIGCAPDCTLDTSGCTECTDPCEHCSVGAGCVGGSCTSCVDSGDCCAPLNCLFGQCVLF